MTVATLSIDLAKRVFQLHGVDNQGNPVIRKSITRAKLPQFIYALPPCLIVMEACGGSHYWARRFQQMGHTVKLICANFVKPFVKGNKNIATMRKQSAKPLCVRPCASCR